MSPDGALVVRGSLGRAGAALGFSSARRRRRSSGGRAESLMAIAGSPAFRSAILWLPVCREMVGAPP